MEIRYYILTEEGYIRADKQMYDDWKGDKYIRSGFTCVFPDGSTIDTAKMFLGLRK